MQTLVSVIIPFYNEERFLVEAVESVLLQEYENWELLLVDDGSSDKSTAVAKSYAEKYSDRITYCEHEGHINKGLSATRNSGIRKAKGELITFLDADDIWLPKKLTNQVAIFQLLPGIAMVAEASIYWYSWSGNQQQDVVIPVGALQDKVYQPRELVQYLYPLSDGAAPCPSGLMVTKQALAAAGGFEEIFTLKYQLYEDQAFLHKIYLREKVYISSSCNNKYRQRDGSIVQKVNSEGHYHIVRKYFLEWLEAYIQYQQINDKDVLRLLQKAIAPYRYPQTYFICKTLPGKIKRMIKRWINLLIK